MNACLQMRKVMLRKVNNLFKVIYLLLRETDPPKTKSGLFQRPVFFYSPYYSVADALALWPWTFWKTD